MSKRFDPIIPAHLEWRDAYPYSLDFDDIYFSKSGGLDEARHVFIDGNLLLERWRALNHQPDPIFVIAETGFGCGLNFLLTYALWKQYAPQNARLFYYSSEIHPLSFDDIERVCMLWPSLSLEAQNLLSQYPILAPGFHALAFEDDRINLTLMLGDSLTSFRELLITNDAKHEPRHRTFHVDAWFLDGFSPLKNPLMWSDTLFSTLGMLSKKGSTFATYSVPEVVRDGLTKAGFKVIKTPVCGKKKEMCSGSFEAIPSSRGQRFTPWHLSSQQPHEMKKAIVLGAGLAGCHIAYALARKGWEVSLLDQAGDIAKGASGNRHAILYPKLSAFHSPLTQFMLNAYLFAVKIYRDLLKKFPIGHLGGILQLAYHEKERSHQSNLAQWLAIYPSLGKLIDNQEASMIAGIPISNSALFLPLSGFINIPALCQTLVHSDGIKWRGGSKVNQLVYADGLWHLCDEKAPVLILANGFSASFFKETAHLPLKPMRGQMTTIKASHQSLQLKVPLCADAHVLPAINGCHDLGATYHQDNDSNLAMPEDDALNLSKLSAISDQVLWSDEVVDQWVGVRAAAPDYLPMVGPVADKDRFKEQYKAMQGDPKRFIQTASDCYPGLYVAAGFGSRGLTSIPICAEWLASFIHGEPTNFTRSMMQSLSPSRFLRRELMRG